ncbi:histidine kinase [Polaribacter sp. R77954]|uniref:histidine kinase n=1 Tax=Polaribacter sp. R77954 TaxID=3093870 RepID=UPI0037CAFF8B
MLEAISKYFEINPLGIFSVFIIGFLIVIFLQNIFFYSSYKDKAYMWYAIYVFLILLDQTIINISIFSFDVLGKSLYYIPIHPALEWLYNSAYLIFVIEFGGLFLFEEKTARKMKQIVKYLAYILVLLFVLDFLFQGYFLVRRGFLFLLVPALIILSVIIYFYLFKMKTPVKYYIIIGSLAFSIFSILGLTNSIFFGKEKFESWWLFYIGVFIENIFFSLGLVVKQGLILKERNESQEKLIIQYKENERLKSSINERLEKEVSLKTEENISLIKEAEKEKIKQLELAFEKEIAELKVSSLKSQMNPHFIFNSLNSIKINIIKNNKENAVYYLNKFSKLIRKILTISREKEVSLQDEIDTLELYVSIENLRFKNEIEFVTNIDKSINLETIKIPPLILQPFVENAIWHGLSPKEGEKKLQLSITKTDSNYIQIAIEDNGIGRKKAQEFKAQKMLKRESIGLKLTQERLAIFSNHLKQKHQIIFEDLVSGTRVIVKLFTD